MSLKSHFELLAAYNQRMNSQVYEAAGRLSELDLTRQRGAFFGSILGTLNHILVADTIWLQRFAVHPSGQNSLVEVVKMPSPTSLDQILFDDFNSLFEHRTWLDAQIIKWIAELSDSDLDFILSYKSTRACLSLLYEICSN